MSPASIAERTSATAVSIAAEILLEDMDGFGDEVAPTLDALQGFVTNFDDANAFISGGKYREGWEV